MKFYMKIIEACMLALVVGLAASCSQTENLSKAAPYNNYAGKNVVLVRRLPLEINYNTLKPSKELLPGTYVFIKGVYLQKNFIQGPIVPAVAPSSSIYAIVQYRDPITGIARSMSYSLGIPLSNHPLGYSEQICVAPWEPRSTPALRYVGKNGKGFKG